VIWSAKNLRALWLELSLISAHAQSESHRAQIKLIFFQKALSKMNKTVDISLFVSNAQLKRGDSLNPSIALNQK